MLPLFCVRIKPVGRTVSWFVHPVREPGAIYGRCNGLEPEFDLTGTRRVRPVEPLSPGFDRRHRHAGSAGRYRGRTEPLDGRKDAGEQSAADSRLGRLERDGSGVADDPRSDPDEAGPQAGRRPVGPRHSHHHIRPIARRPTAAKARQPHPTVETEPDITRFACTLRVIRDPPLQPAQHAEI